MVIEAIRLSKEALGFGCLYGTCEAAEKYRVSRRTLASMVVRDELADVKNDYCTYLSGENCFYNLVQVNKEKSISDFLVSNEII